MNRSLALAAALLLSLPPAARALSAQQLRVLQANVDRAFLLQYLHVNRDKVRPASGAVRAIAARIVRATGSAFSNTVHVYVMDSPEPNAQTSPGGNIFLYKGLLDAPLSREETAAVLAHEVGHLVRGHWYARLVRGLGAREAAAYTARTYGQASAEIEALRLKLRSLSYDREEEFEADETGARLLVAAGFDPRALISALEKCQALRTPQQAAAAANPYLANHPAVADRVARLRRLIAAGALRPVRRRLF